MKKKISIVIIACMLFISILIPSVYADELYVTVKLPSFPVNLNGIIIDNKTIEYPLIVYKDITYVPMTYYDSRFLGLESIWDSKNGLTIEKTGVNWSYQKYQSNKPNNNTYTAKIATFNIKVNGKKIDNSKEEYPLLLFRNITYFPLTWRFAVDEFGWKYSFDNTNGLAISSSNNGTSAGQLTLPIVTRENGEKGAFTMAGDYFYYEGEKGVIYQTPINNPTQRKAVYNLPLWIYGDSYVYAKLKTVNNQAFLSYHVGGAAMGTDYEIIINEDGTNEIFDSGYSNKKIFGNISIRVDQWAPPFLGNLTIKSDEKQEYEVLGNTDYLYGWIIKASGEGSPSDDLDLIGDNLYILATYKPDEHKSTTGIYRVNIHTNSTERVCEEAANGFKIFDETIYFTDLNNLLYKVSTEGGKAEKLTEEPISHYNIFNGKIYYSLKNRSDQLFIYGNDLSINPGGKLKSLEIQNGYMVAIFDKESESQYKMMIINDNGKVIYKTMENVLLVRIENGKIVFVKDN